MERVTSACWVFDARLRVCSDQASWPVPSLPVRICFTTGQRSSRFFSMNAPDSDETYVVKEPLLLGWVAIRFFSQLGRVREPRLRLFRPVTPLSGCHPERSEGPASAWRHGYSREALSKRV